PKNYFKFVASMDTTEARLLIERAIHDYPTATWADLGCGTGTFTYALAGLLGEGSKVWAVDKLTQYLGTGKGPVAVEFLQMDIERQPLPFTMLDGIIMANTLHYIRDQKTFLGQLPHHLKKAGKIVLVEYDTDRGNQWVPFPVTYDKAQALLADAGFKNISHIGERPSTIRNGMIFACVGQL
nr:class I SAM-dependent methyltransferase [Cyclobacteriaceae bacterium]